MSYYFEQGKGSEEEGCRCQWTSVVLVSPASASSASANSTLILHRGVTFPLFQVTGFVGESPPSSRKPTHDSGSARENDSRLDT